MENQKKVIIIGGTGFLGYHASVAFIQKGWEVTSIGLPPRNPAAFQSEIDRLKHYFPSQVNIALRDIELMADNELMDCLVDHHGIVFAAGLDDRYLSQKPAYPKYYRNNVENPKRILSLAQKTGIKRSVTLGSYFAYLTRIWPEMKLEERHPYIRSRVEQEKVVTTIPGLEGMVLELPYIFGGFPIPGWKPLFAPLLKYMRSSPIIPYMRGGSACVSAVTVGRAIVAAMERGVGGTCYPIGQSNLHWDEMLSLLARVDNRAVKIIPLPKLIISFALWCVHHYHQMKGKEAGLNLRYFSSLQTANAFIDPTTSRLLLGYVEGDLTEAFAQTVHACVKSYNG